MDKLDWDANVQSRQENEGGREGVTLISELPCSAGSEFICALGQHKSLLIWIRCVLLGKQQSTDPRLMISKAETWAPLPGEDEASSGELWVSDNPGSLCSKLGADSWVWIAAVRADEFPSWEGKWLDQNQTWSPEHKLSPMMRENTGMGLKLMGSIWGFGWRVVLVFSFVIERWVWSER